VANVVTASGELQQGVAGQAVTVTLAEDVDVSRGDIITDGKNGVEVSTQLTARLLWMAEAPLRAGTTFLVKLGARTVTATVTALHSALNLSDYSSFAAETIGINDIAVASLKLDEPVAHTDYRRCRELGGFVLIDRFIYDSVAMGLIDCTVSAGAPRGRPGPPPWDQVAARASVWIRNARERPLRSVVKAITWRTTGSVDTFVLSYIFTQSVQISAAISTAEIVTKFVLYYIHERLWARSRFGYQTEPKDPK
jgi:sulfate adenylyltransferase subunit 1 (EFTu-like GTPase family)